MYMKPTSEEDIDAHNVIFGVLNGRGLKYSYVVLGHDFIMDLNERLGWSYKASRNLHGGNGSHVRYAFMRHHPQIDL